MRIGDLVEKRWGAIEPYQQGTVGIIVGEERSTHALNPLMSGCWIVVLYPGSGKPAYKYRSSEFEVKSENRRFIDN